MTSDRFRECLALLHWSQRGLAEILDTHPTTVRRMATGGAAIPDNVAAWLEELAAAHVERPVPAGWRGRAAQVFSPGVVIRAARPLG